MIQSRQLLSSPRGDDKGWRQVTTSDDKWRQVTTSDDKSWRTINWADYNCIETSLIGSIHRRVDDSIATTFVVPPGGDDKGDDKWRQILGDSQLHQISFNWADYNYAETSLISSMHPRFDYSIATTFVVPPRGDDKGWRQVTTSFFQVEVFVRLGG